MELSETTQMPAAKDQSFKRLELGTVPNDWAEVTLFETTGKRKEWFDDGDWVEAEFITDHGIRLIQTGNIGEGVFLQKAGKKYVSEDSFKLLGCKEIYPGDLLISRLAAPAGRACVLPNIGEDKMITSVDVTIVRPVDEVADKRYLNQLFLTKEWFEAVAVRCGGTTHSRIPRSELGKIILPLPKIIEQRAIATALSDVDALLGSLDALIAKKKAMKQGAMQQLLTGKQRLPGFKGEWEVKRLGEMLILRHGKPQHAVVKDNGKYPILGTGGIMAWTDEYLYNKPSVMIGRKGTIDLPRYMDTPFWTVDTLFYSEIFDSADPKFLYYCFWLIDWYRYNESSGVPSMIASTVENIEIKVPSTKKEQTAIATVLSDMDAELESLAARRAKTALLKQGMMQELLTGRTRLN